MRTLSLNVFHPRGNDGDRAAAQPALAGVLASAVIVTGALLLTAAVLMNENLFFSSPTRVLSKAEAKLR